MKKIMISFFLILIFCSKLLNAYALFVFGPQATNKNWLKNSTKIYDDIKSQLTERKEGIDFYPHKVATGIFAFLQTKYSQQELATLYQNSFSVLVNNLTEAIINTCEKLTPPAMLSLVGYGRGVQVIQGAIIQLTAHARGIKAFRKIKNVFAIEQEGFAYLPIPDTTQTDQIKKITFLNNIFGKFMLLDAEDFGRSKQKAVPLLINKKDFELGELITELQRLTSKTI